MTGHEAATEMLRAVHAAYEDLGRRLAVGEAYSGLLVEAFPQTWANTACGYGGIAAQMLTTSYTVIVTAEDVRYVYIDKRLAYTVTGPDEDFDLLASRRQVPGQSVRRRTHPDDIPGA